MTHSEIHALLTLTFIKGFTPKKIYDLIKTTKSAITAVDLLQNEGHFTGLNPNVQEIATAQKKADCELEICHKNYTNIIPYFSEDYPFPLKEIKDPPPLIWLQGKIELSKPRIAIIGTRTASMWGNEQAEHFGYELAKSGCIVISGLARGIDTSAHRGSLESGQTIAILGSGIGNIYPAENKELAKRIAHKGAVISELPYLHAPTKFTFPKRNRLISALSSALLLIEAPIKSGAMITMNIGHVQNKPLFTLPGRANNPSYSGNHTLIKEKRAQLIDTSFEILEILHLARKEVNTENSPSRLFIDTNYSYEEKKILELLSESALSLDELCTNSLLPVQKIQTALSKLILQHTITELPGKNYKIAKRDHCINSKVLLKKE